MTQEKRIYNPVTGKHYPVKNHSSKARGGLWHKKTTLLTLISLLFLLAVCIAPAAATSPYADLLQDPTRITEDKLADFADALGWRDELATYQMEMENYEMQVAQQQAEIQQAQELQEAAAALGLDISSTVESALESIATTAPPYTDEELAALDAESAAYYDAFAANYVATAAFPGSGSGTQGDPYIITNRAELAAMADDLTAYYQLANHIDLGGSSSPWTPIGTGSAPFLGTLDGYGYVLQNMYITGTYTQSTPAALISVLSGGTIDRLGLSNINIIVSGMSWYGGIAGRIINSGSCSQCWVTGSATIPATGTNFGGITGESLTASISDCWTNVQITGGNSVGGISAVMTYNGNINRVYALGDITSTTLPAGGIAWGSRQYPPNIANSVALMSSIDNGNRISTYVGNLNQNYANAAMLVNGNAVSGGTTSNANGADVSASTYNTQAFWENTLGWDFDTVWYWDTTTNLPKLQFYPEIKSASLSPAQSTVSNSIALSAAVQNYQVLQWQYQTLPGGYWQNISGATTPTYQWQPPQPGHYAVRLIATVNNELVISSDILYCVQYGVAAPISPAASPDISATTNYNPTSQYSLTDQVTELKYISNNLSIWIAGNTTYLYNNGQNQPQALNPYVAGTITQANIAPDGSVSAITDWAMPIAITNGQNQPQALNLDNRTPIAITHNTDYIAVIYNTTDLIIYSATTGMPIANTTTTATKLSTNSNTGTIIGYNPTSTTITSYTISGSTINTKTATIPKTPVSITDVWGSEYVIITTTANTYLYTLDETGTITNTATSTETAPLINIDATSISTYIGSNTATLYIIDSTGTTIGTYTAGNTITITGIAHQSGLYAFASGNDNQVYFLSKSSSDNWVLNDIMPIGQTPTAGAVSFSGDQYLIASGTSVYTISLNSGGGNVSAYYLNGIIIAASGAPYHGLFSVNGNQYQTDSAGKFVISVSPGTTYTITAGTTTTQYTATNIQYQTVAIKIQPDPYATNVDYSANWNSTTQAIDMTYTDQTGRTNSISWKIRNTATNDIVYQQTTTSGQTLSYPLPAEQQYTNYQITMTADRTTTAGLTSPVQNTWLITPSGSNPISIPGLDDTGKNILFCAVLMIFGALFGVVHSTKGAVAVSFLAAALRYFELITIPWILIIVAATIAIIAALARGGGNN